MKLLESDDIRILIIYDIVSNRQRRLLSNYLQGIGFRVQKSAFEAKISKRMLEQMKKEVSKFITSEDSLRIYKIWHNSQILALGTSYEKFVDDENIII